MRREAQAPVVRARDVTGYSAFRILEELLRVDPAHHILGLRLNFFLAAVLTLASAAWFLRTQRTSRSPAPRASDAAPERAP
jgi:prolipoprotein diacylglyceryltransferase